MENIGNRHRENTYLKTLCLWLPTSTFTYTNKKMSQESELRLLSLPLELLDQDYLADLHSKVTDLKSAHPQVQVAVDLWITWELQMLPSSTSPEPSSKSSWIVVDVRLPLSFRTSQRLRIETHLILRWDVHMLLFYVSYVPISLSSCVSWSSKTCKQRWKVLR